MSVIENVIPQQAFERIRDRIGSILLDEINHQVLISYDNEIEAGVYIERFVPFDKTEMPAINVTLARGSYDNKNSISADGTYNYSIDVYTSAKSSDAKKGDSLSAVRLHRLLGICRAILENPQYKTLGFAAPFIARVSVVDINIAEPIKQDAISVIMGRLTLAVRVPENVELITPRLIEGYDTTVKLGLTNKGYQFSGDNDTTPLTEGNVTVNNIFFSVVEEGGTLNIVVVNQDGDPVGEKIGNEWVVPLSGGFDLEFSGVVDNGPPFEFIKDNGPPYINSVKTL